MADSEFQRPTLAENISMLRNDLFARLDVSDTLRRMDEDVRAKVYAAALHTVYGYIDYLAMNMLPDLCDESWLARHAAMKRCPRKGATAASGYMRWEGVSDGLKVTAGSVIQRDDLVQYTATADATSSGGVLRVPIACSSAGAVGNADDGTSLILVTPVNGLPSSGVADTLTGGFDTEELEMWRARVIERYYWTPQGGADGDYVVWAKEVPGITRGNPQTGTPATDLDDDYFDMLQEELCSVVEASGASLEKERHDQLLTALRALLLSRKNPFGDIKSDGTVQTALENLGLGDASGYVGRLLKIQVFTASGTVTKTPGAKKWRIKCLGGGGGSSAAPATGSNEVSVSNGGGAGAYAEGIYDVSSITTASVVIGSGGAGGTADSIYGADGGASSVGSFISSPGGKVGLPAGPANPPFQPVANTNSDGPTGWNIVGSSGAGAEPAVAVTYSYAAGSRGSNSIFGVGGSIPAINDPANPGGGYGSGASGCSNGQSQSAKSGAAGRPGIVIIEELA